MTKTTVTKHEDGICLNNQRVGNLIKYLKGFPPEAKVEIWHDNKSHDCQICCNFEHQKEKLTVQLMLGTFLREA